MVILSEQQHVVVWPPDHGGGLDNSEGLVDQGLCTFAQVMQSHCH